MITEKKTEKNAPGKQREPVQIEHQWTRTRSLNGFVVHKNKIKNATRFVGDLLETC